MPSALPWFVVLGFFAWLYEWRSLQSGRTTSSTASPYRSAASHTTDSPRHAALRRRVALVGVALSPAIIVTRGFTWVAALHALFALVFRGGELPQDPSLLAIDALSACFAVGIAAIVYLAACRAVIRGGVDAWVLSRSYFRFAGVGDLMAVGLVSMFAPRLLVEYWLFIALLGAGFAHAVLLTYAAHQH